MLIRAGRGCFLLPAAAISAANRLARVGHVDRGAAVQAVGGRNRDASLELGDGGQPDHETREPATDHTCALSARCAVTQTWHRTPSKPARQLRVESVLEGHIQRVQDRISVSVVLRSVRDGRQLWAGRFDEQWTNIFAAQDLVSQRVAEALALTLTGDEHRQLTKRYTESPEAYLAYIRGRYFWNSGTAEGYRKAIEEFERAIELDPGYSLAFAGLADSYNMLASYGNEPMRDAHRKARAAAQKAVDLDDQVAEAHTSLGAIISASDWGWADAEKTFSSGHRLEAGLCDGTRVVLGVPVMDGAARQGH